MNKQYIAILAATGANFASLQAALSRIGAASLITNNPKEIQSASHVILPGVGAAGYAMEQLSKLGLIDIIKNLTQPVLGICLGMQLLCASSEEENTSCLNIIPIPIQKIRSAKIVPHMGWNKINVEENCGSQLLSDIDNTDMYFVHSFYAPTNNPFVIATSTYGSPFAAAIHQRNFYGVQFHPEKSGKIGEQLLRNFLRIK